MKIIISTSGTGLDPRQIIRRVVEKTGKAHDYVLALWHKARKAAIKKYDSVKSPGFRAFQLSVFRTLVGVASGDQPKVIIAASVKKPNLE